MLKNVKGLYKDGTIVLNKNVIEKLEKILSVDNIKKQLCIEEGQNMAKVDKEKRQKRSKRKIIDE